MQEYTAFNSELTFCYLHFLLYIHDSLGVTFEASHLCT